MQRRWRPFRLIFSALLLGLAVFLYIYWPAQPRWTRARGDQYPTILGFCPSSDVLLLSTGISIEATYQRESHAREMNQRFDPSTTTMKLIGLDMASGDEAFVHHIPYTGGVPIAVVTSPRGEYLAIDEVQTNRILIVHAPTGNVTSQLENANARAGYFTRSFSSDGSVLANLTEITLQVWKLNDQPQRREVAVDDLKTPRFIASQPHDPKLIAQPVAPVISISKDNRYLALAMHHVVTVLEVETLRIIGQSMVEGRPQFLDDGTLVMTSTRYRAMKPLVAKYLLDSNGLHQTFLDDRNEPVAEAELDRKGDAYLTGSIIYPEWTWPEWVPTTVTHKANDWLGLDRLRVKITLRDLTNGKELSHRRFISDMPRIGICGTGMSPEDLQSYVPPIPFAVTVSPDHAWMTRLTNNTLELWPLDTLWRPWYCWATVTGLSAIACFLLWHSRRTTRRLL